MWTPTRKAARPRDKFGRAIGDGGSKERPAVFRCAASKVAVQESWAPASAGIEDALNPNAVETHLGKISTG